MGRFEKAKEKEKIEVGREKYDNVPNDGRRKGNEESSEDVAGQQGRLTFSGRRRVGARLAAGWRTERQVGFLFWLHPARRSGYERWKPRGWPLKRGIRHLYRVARCLAGNVHVQRLLQGKPSEQIIDSASLDHQQVTDTPTTDGRWNAQKQNDAPALRIFSHSFWPEYANPLLSCPPIVSALASVSHFSFPLFLFCFALPGSCVGGPLVSLF